MNSTIDKQLEAIIDCNLENNCNEMSSQQKSPQINDKSVDKMNDNKSETNSSHIIRSYGSMSSIQTFSCDVNESHYFVPIEGYEVMEQKARYTVFRLRVEDLINDQKWLVFRRYTDFVRLHRKLSQLFPKYRFSLPSKKWFGSNFDPLFLEDRQLGLQVFLNSIMSLKCVTNCEAVRQFLCLDDKNDTNTELERNGSHSSASSDGSQESVHKLKTLLKSKDFEIEVLKKEINELKFQIESNNCNSEESNRIQTEDQLSTTDIGVRDSPDGTSNPSNHLTQH